LALSWSLISSLPSKCHLHPFQTLDDVAGGSFVTRDHEYPSYLELRLRAGDPGQLTDTQSVRLDPKTVSLTLDSTPAGFTPGIQRLTATGTLLEGGNPGLA
jgi:hypothetical protein